MRLDFFKLFGLGTGILLLAASFPAFAGATYQYIQGGTGSTTAPAGQVLYGGASSYQSTATTTASCSGSASCSSFTVIGSSPVTITATGGGSSDPFTHPSYGSATTTTLGLLGGLLDTASTTFTSSPQFNSLFAMSVNPDGTTADTFNFAGRPNVTIPVPYVRPTQSNQNIAFDIFPNGTPGNGFGNNIYGVAWEDVCSTDIFAGPDYECLHLGKALNGASNVSSSQGGNGLIQPLAFQLFGGNTGVGTSSPYAYFAIQASTTAGKPNEPLFAIASSSTDLIVTNGGLVGIGTSSPYQTLSVTGNEVVTGNVTWPSITGTQCIHTVNGAVSGTGSDCGSSGSITGTPGQNVYIGPAGTALATSSIFTTPDMNVAIGTTTDAGTFALTISNSNSVQGANVLQLINTGISGAGGGGGIQDFTSFIPSANGDRLGFFTFGYTPGTAGETNRNAVGVFGFADQAWTIGSSQGAYLSFQVTPDGSATRAEAMRLAANSDLGIGTTTPNWTLQAAGTHGNFALTDNSAGTNLKHWLFTSEGGNLYIGTTTDLYATSTTAALSILNNGQVTVGANGPPNGTGGFTDQGSFTLGSSTTNEGSVKWNNQAKLSYLGIYDTANALYYGIAPNCQGTSGFTGICGYFNGVAVQGTSNGGSTPIFGVLNNAQSDHGLGNVAFTIEDGNQVFTFNNTLDDGSGNANIAKKLSVASSTPFGMLSINPTAGTASNEFVIGSSTGTALIVNNSGKFAIGTSTATAQFVEQAASTTAGTVQTPWTGVVFVVSALENNTLKIFEEIDQWGDLITSGDTPSVTGGTSSVSGNQRNGLITVTGTALTSVTLTFAHPWPVAPDCTESDNQTASVGDISSISTTQVVFNFSVGVNSANLWYICQAHQ